MRTDVHLYTPTRGHTGDMDHHKLLVPLLLACLKLPCEVLQVAIKHMWQSQVENEHYSYHFLTTFLEFTLL